MKKATIFLLTILSYLTYGQNLVENPGIENTGECPIVETDLEDIAEPWTNYFGTPDYFHMNCGFPGSATTTNFAQPFDGSGFVGIAVYGDTGAYEREYLHGELKEPLIGGVYYRITFYVRPLNNPTNATGYGINNIGMFLSQEPLDSAPTGNIYPVEPQVNARTPIIAESYWTPVCGIYKAKGGEKYITIGNFYEDFETQTIPLTGATVPQRAYYMVDGVEVLENDLPQLPADTIICIEERIDLNIQAPDVTVRWSDESTGSHFLITEPGTYYATISNPSCSYTDTILVEPTNCVDCKVYVANAFTPNGDGVNDEFVVSPSCVKHPTEEYFKSYHISIFDRWGQKVFEATDPSVSWDGNNVDGGGVYTYTIEYQFQVYRKTQTLVKRGTVMLIR